MNFFDQQLKAKTITNRILFLLILSLCILALILNIAIGLILSLGSEHPLQLAIEILKTPLGIIPLWICITLFVFFFGFVGSLIEYWQSRKGGEYYVTRIGAVQSVTVPAESISSYKLNRMHNIVDEMAIASGIHKPKIYVLEKELGLNAFVIGRKPEDTVLVLTKGAIDTFSREELQGVIAHEFGHIANNDTSINLYLLSVIAGLAAIYNLGSFLIDIEYYTNISDTSKGLDSTESEEAKSNKAKMYLISLTLLILGYLGVFFARLIQRAISRQREYLADASSVQFTRNNEGLALALYRIYKGEKTHLHCRNKTNINHFCLFPSEKINFFNGLLATHPPILDRIKAIYNGNLDRLEQKYLSLKND